MTLRAVLFDLDGTLLDTAPDFVVVVNRLLAEENKPALPEEAIRATVSQGARALITLAFKLDEDDPGFEALRLRLLKLYSEHLAVHTQTFPGIDKLLETLTQQDIAWGIVTNKPDIYTQPILAALDLFSEPTSVICPDHVQHRKPHPESLHLACAEIGCNINEAIYIGDHKRDIDCGKNAGMPTIAAAYGYIALNENPADWQADHIVSHADDLWPLIQRYL